MRTAQLAPLSESVPPRRYGGTERIVSYLTEELVRQGHDVTLFASGDSQTSAALMSVCDNSLRCDETVSIPDAYTFQSMEHAFRLASKFDVMHSHLDLFAFALASRCSTPVVTTLHGRLDLSELRELYKLHDDLPLVSISDAQRGPMPNVNWARTIHHGLPENLYRFDPDGGDYLAFLGRLTAEKFPTRAIEIAKRTGIPLKIAAKVDPTDQDYFKRCVEPLLDHPLVEFIGEITDDEKQAFLGNARALVAPFDWPEPFGLVFIEALACGTPVLAYRRGSIPEIIDHGTTGFVCDSLEQMIAAVPRAANLSRAACREAFEANFTARRMAQDYVNLYEQVTEYSYPQALSV